MAALLLSEYLSDAAKRGFAWGRCDCILFACDWAARKTGIDPAAPWRGYASEDEARAIITENGSVMDLLDRGLRAAGWMRTNAAKPGDIVCVRPKGHPEDVAGIATIGGRMALLTARGLVLWPLQPKAVWTHG